MSTKEAMIAFIRSLPEDVTPQDVAEKIAFKVQLDEALRQSERGEGIDHEEFKKRMTQWLS
ncbi:MAG: hypothetical protein LC104_08850 [Bacteroidales bacterium]|nr:hypothetical protein [Bacteroidales bacterium]